MSDPVRIALCDDTDAFRMLLRMLFDGDDGYDVVGEAADGIEIVEVCRETRPDVLLLDVAMPRRDGIEALPHVLAASPDTCVVMYTGFLSRDVERRALAAGATAVLVKGMRPDELLAAVRDACCAEEAGTVDTPTRTMT